MSSSVRLCPAGDARPGTPAINGLNESLLAPNNPNPVQPFRLDRSQFETADQDHVYGDEQRAFDSGLMDQFVEKVGRGAGPNGEPGGMVMGYYDGNTVTALWNYAQAFAMSDNSYSTTFGPSTPGALNLISGQTHGFAQTISAVTPAGTVIGDPQPTGDICSSRDNTTSIDPNNKNIGDLLNARNVTWGWFEGGFRDCKQTHANKAGVVSKDYIPHHEPSDRLLGGGRCGQPARGLIRQGRRPIRTDMRATPIRSTSRSSSSRPSTASSARGTGRTLPS
jgi:phospholipase C